MKLDGKLIVRMVAILVVLLILYVVSSGPALSYAVRHRTVPGSTFHGFQPQPGQPWASENFYQAVRKFYEPMLQVAEAIGFEKPINAYLEAWNLSALKVSGGHNLSGGTRSKTNRW